MELKASHILAALVSAACIGLFPALSAAAEEAAPADAAAEIISTQTGWINANGRITYRFADGHTASGETEIDGIYYLFSYSGTLKTDWQTVNGKRCYFDPATGQAVFGWVEYFGCRYYVTPEQGKLTGTQEIDGMTYAFDEDGTLLEVVQSEPSPAVQEMPAAETTTAVIAAVGSEAVIAETALPAAQPAAAPVTAAIEPITAFAPEAPAETAIETAVVTDAPVPVTEPFILETIAVETALETAAETIAEPVTETVVETIAETVETTVPETAPAVETPAETEPVPVTDVPEDTGAAPSATASAFELAVPDYKQKDPAWVNAPLGGQTIGKYGCLVTAMAMLHSYDAVPCTPVDMAGMLSFTADGSLRKWDDIAALGYTVETYSTTITPEILEKLYQLLRENRPVVLGSTGSWQHYVIVTGYTGNGGELRAEDFLIHDPGYPNRITLADHLASFSTIYKLIY